MRHLALDSLSFEWIADSAHHAVLPSVIIVGFNDRSDLE